jgi:uncharacterized protein
MTTKLLMPKATAVWLIENTTLTFRQISIFTGLHELEVKGIADGDVAAGVLGLSPIQSGQLTVEEIKRCEAEPEAELRIVERDLPEVQTRAKGPRYTPVTKRTEKPDAIAWLIKNYPGMSDAGIGRLLATTKDTIKSVRERTHWNIANIKPNNPVLMGLCSSADLELEVSKIRKSKQHLNADAQAASNAEAEGESEETSSKPEGTGANPFAAALAAYAQAAQKKVKGEPTVEDVFGKTGTDDNE